MKTRKILSLLLVITMIFSLFAGMQRETSADDLAYPTIPKYGDGTNLEDYNPKEDGYYGYLRIRYYPAGVENDSLTAYLPVLVWKNTVFVRAEQLAEVSGITLTEDSRNGAYAAHFSAFERHLLISPQRERADYFLGENPQESLYSLQVSMEPASFYTLEQEPVLWVPFTQVLTLMGVTAVCKLDARNNPVCTIIPPRENSWDVLARLCSSRIRDRFNFSFYELEGYSKAAWGMGSSAAISTTFDQMLHWKGEYAWYYVLCSLSGFTDTWGFITHQDIDPSGDQWNRIVGKKMLEALWFCSEDEVLAMVSECTDAVDIELRLVTEVLDETPYMFGHVGDLNLNTLFRTLETASKNSSFSWATRAGFTEVQKDVLKLMDDSEQLIESVNKLQANIKEFGPDVGNFLFTEIGAVFSFLNYTKQYNSRDTFLENCLEDFLKDSGSHDHIGSAAAEAMQKEYNDIKEDYLGYGTDKAIFDALSSFTADTLTSLVSAPGQLYMVLYRAAVFAVPCFKKTLDSMDSYLTALFGVSLETDTEEALFTRMDKCKTWTMEERKDAIEAAYLYLRTCLVTGDLAMEALELDKKAEERDTINKEILSEIAILQNDYNNVTGMVSLGFRELMDEYYALDDSGLIDSVIKLYVTISGDVKNMEDDSPVPDAECNIYGRDNEFINRFHPDEEGKYEKISVPVLEPVYIEENPDLDFMLSFVFTSPTVEGEDELSLKFESGLEKEMKTAYLGGSGAYGVAVEAGGAVYYIKYSMDSHMSPGLTGFFALAANQPNSVVRLKDGEETVLAETPASGRIAAARGQIFFTGEYREDGRTIKAVDMDGGPVKTLCTGELLGVLESGSHIIVSNYTGLYTMDTTPSDTQETYVMNKISSEAGYIANYNDRVIYYETTGNSIYVYSIAAADDDDRLFLGRLEVDFKDSLSGISLGEVRMPVIDGDEYLYISYGTIAGSYIMYQGGRIARFNLNREDSAEILAGTGTLVDADFTVNEDGSVNSYEYQKGRLSAGLYESNTWFYYSRDGILYDISREDGHEEPVLYPEEYAAISNSKIDVNDNGTYLKIYYYTKQDDRLYIYCTLGIANGDGLGWRPSYDLAGGVLIQKDLKTGEVNFLFRY